MRSRIAERAYRYAVDKGFSLFGWYRLMKLYVSSSNPKACLVCIIEVVKYYKEHKVVFKKELPDWIENILSAMCSGCGLN